MALDPRLADVMILAMAAKRALARQGTAPGRTVVLQVVYAAGLDPSTEPPELGERYEYALPPHASGGGAC